MDPHFDGVIFQTHAAELERRLRKPFPSWCAVDVRSAAEFAVGHLPGSISMSADELSAGLPEGTDRATEFFVIGSAPGDARVRPVSEALRRHGTHRVVEFGGGLAEWEAFGFALDQPEA